MKYSMHLRQYMCKSPYPYYVIQADEDLTKFHVWSKRKTINAWLYSEQEVLDMIEQSYPGAERSELFAVVHKCWRARLTWPRDASLYPAKNTFLIEANLQRGGTLLYWQRIHFWNQMPPATWMPWMKDDHIQSFQLILPCLLPLKIWGPLMSKNYLNLWVKLSSCIKNKTFYVWCGSVLSLTGTPVISIRTK